MEQNKTEIVIYFDGVCNLCNFFVDFVIRRDQKKIFFFGPLQGKTALKNLGDQAKNLNTVVVKNLKEVILTESEAVPLTEPKTVLLTESQAVLFVLSRLSFPWSTVAILGRILPRQVCDWIYRKVAENRYSLFGHRDSCRLPTPEESTRFLE